MRSVWLAAALFALHAPMQCGSGSADEAREDTPPESLYHLATHLKAKGETKAYQETLRYLVDRYPSSRFAVRAKNDLERERTGSGAP